MGISQAKTGWRSHKLLIQFAEYLVGGSVWFWGGMATFAVCFEILHWPWWVAKALGDLFGWSANYVIQRYWAFYTSRLKGQDRRIIFRYTLVNAADMVFEYIILASLIFNNLTPYIGFFASAAFTGVWDYLWYRFWVFKSAK